MISDIYKEASALEKSLTELYSREEALRTALNNAAEIEAEYKLKLAKEYRLAEGTVKDRENLALEKCKEEYIAYVKADAVRAFTKEAMRNSQQALSARQSLLTASVKSDLGYANDKRIT